MSSIVLPETGAIFNLPPAERKPGLTRRWWLGRSVVDPSDLSHYRGRVLSIGVQPSDADEKENDPTIRREINFVYRWRYRYLDKVNLHDLCSADPDTLYTTAESVLPINDDYIFAAAERARAEGGIILCCWGNHGAYMARGAKVRRQLLERGHTLYVLGFTKEKYPIHPLARGKYRVPDDQEPMLWA